MRKRNIQIIVRLNAKEQQHLAKQVKKSGLSRSIYPYPHQRLRAQRASPPDYYAMMRELRHRRQPEPDCGKANATGHIDRAMFQYEANRLRTAVLDIQAAVTSPERRENNGNHGDMGRNRPP